MIDRERVVGLAFQIKDDYLEIFRNTGALLDGHFVLQVALHGQP